MFEVTLKPGHPTGHYLVGVVFTKEPVKFVEVPPEVANDPFLVVTEVEEKEPGKKKELAEE